MVAKGTCFFWVDASFDPDSSLGTYGISIDFEGSRWNLSGVIGRAPTSHWCEWRSIGILLEKLPKLKKTYSINTPYITINIDDQSIYEAILSLIPPPHDPREAKQLATIQNALSELKKKMHINFALVSSSKNRAHALAVEHLRLLTGRYKKATKTPSIKVSLGDFVKNKLSRFLGSVSSTASRSEGCSEPAEQIDSGKKDAFTDLLALLQKIYEDNGVGEAEFAEVKLNFHRNAEEVYWNCKIVVSSKPGSLSVPSDVSVSGYRVIEMSSKRKSLEVSTEEVSP